MFLNVSLSGGERTVWAVFVNVMGFVDILRILHIGSLNVAASPCFFTGFLASFKLPSYEEVAAQPSTPPPPYSSIFALECGAMGGPSSSYHHHHHRHPCPPYLGPVSSGLTSSQSSDYTSCSCESCSLTSPSSTSFSVQVTDEMYNSSRISTPSEAGGDWATVPRLGAGYAPTPYATPPSQVPPDVIPVAAPDVIPVQRRSSNGSDAASRLAPPLSLPLHARPLHPARLPLSPLILLSGLPPGQLRPLVPSDPLGVTAFKKDRDEEASTRGPSHRLTPSLPKQALFPSNVPVFVYCNSKEEQKIERDVDEEEDGEDEDHFRHRLLTGDSGIEVCRCHVKRQEKEEAHKGHGKREERADVLDFSLRAKAAAQLPVPGTCTEQRGHVCSPPGVTQKMSKAIITVASS